MKLFSSGVEKNVNLVILISKIIIGLLSGIKV